MCNSVKRESSPQIEYAKTKVCVIYVCGAKLYMTFHTFNSVAQSLCLPRGTVLKEQNYFMAENNENGV